LKSVDFMSLDPQSDRGLELARDPRRQCAFENREFLTSS
jgi:hypothetical protein